MARTAPSPEEVNTPQSGFRWVLGLLPAIAVNMTQMCGIGPFIAIPIMVATVAAQRRSWAGSLARCWPWQTP